MPDIRVTIKEPPTGKWYNLKVGCSYLVEETAAKELIDSGYALPVIEAAMMPAPRGALTNARKSKSARRPTDNSSGS